MQVRTQRQRVVAYRVLVLFLVIVCLAVVCAVIAFQGAALRAGFLFIAAAALAFAFVLDLWDTLGAFDRLQYWRAPVDDLETRRRRTV